MSALSLPASRRLPVAIAAALALGAAPLSAAPAHAADTASISGHLYGGSTATPIEGGEVGVFVNGAYYSDLTDSSGAYSVTGIPAGSVTIGFYAPGGSNYINEFWNDSPTLAGATYFALAEGQAITGRNATLQVGSTISGIIRDDHGTPLEGAVAVAYRDGAGDSFDTLINYATSGSNGSYSIPRIPLGGVRIGFAFPADGASPFTSTGGLNLRGPAYAGEWYPNEYSYAATFAIQIVEPGNYTAYHASLTALSFVDVPDPTSPFFSAIGWLKTNSISTGTAQPTGLPLFKPSDSVSRQAMASFLYKLSGDSFTAPGTASFADVAVGSPFFTAVEWMKSKGISTGTPQSSGLPLFKPLDAVSRSAMATFLSRYAGATLPTPTTQSFSDVPLSSAVAPAVEWMKTTGISTGTPAEPLPLYKPADPVSRQAMALFLFRVDQYLNPVA